MPKNLENWFEDWYRISVNKKEYSITMLDWCGLNIGFRGLDWDLSGVKKYKLNPAAVFVFKRESDAIMFMLTFGGTLVKPLKSIT